MLPVSCDPPFHVIVAPKSPTLDAPPGSAKLAITPENVCPSVPEIDIACTASTVCPTVPVLGAYWLSPRYLASIVWTPAARALVVKVAVPPDSVPLPSELAPSQNSTCPVGVPVPGVFTLTVAVKVTDSPRSDGSIDVVTAVVVRHSTFCCK